jgi:hypothetical protein
MSDFASIQNLVRTELGGCEVSSQGWHFGKLLLNPPRLIEVRSGASAFQVWAVLSEMSETTSDGYTIAFDPAKEAFCLVCGGVAVGYYRSLLEAINGM